MKTETKTNEEIVMAKDIRVIVATGEVAELVDKGAQIDANIKKLTVEDKAIKEKITTATKDEIKDGEVSVKVSGNSAAVLVTASESVSVDTSAEGYQELWGLLENGFLSKVVEYKKQLAVPPEDIKRAAEMLQESGIRATVTSSVSVKAEDIRKMRCASSVSKEETEAMKVLDKCLSKSITFRIKYEKV